MLVRPGAQYLRSLPCCLFGPVMIFLFPFPQLAIFSLKTTFRFQEGLEDVSAIESYPNNFLHFVGGPIKPLLFININHNLLQIINRARRNHLMKEYREGKPEAKTVLDDLQEALVVILFFFVFCIRFIHRYQYKENLIIRGCGGL